MAKLPPYFKYQGLEHRSDELVIFISINLYHPLLWLEIAKSGGIRALCRYLLGLIIRSLRKEGKA
jgi:hypothetical protein